MRKNSGITLISLIIAVIILIILSSVAINAILNDNGILNKSKLVVEEYSISETQTKIEIAILEIKLEHLYTTHNIMNEILQDLPNKVENLTVEKQGAQLKGICNGYVFTIKRNYEVVMYDYEDPIKTNLSLNKTKLELYPR